MTKFQKHSDKRKAKEKKKKRGEGKDEFKEKKATVAPLVFNNGYFIMASCEKKLLDAKDPFGSNVSKNSARHTHT